MYVVTLGAAMIVMVIGLGAITSVGVERESIRTQSDFIHARAAATSAIELGYYLMRSDANWRTTRTNGAWITDQPLGDGLMSLSVTDPDDSNLSALPNNTVVMKGTGKCGEANFVVEVQLAVDKGGLVVLNGTWKHVAAGP